jgi:hypothetical protein
MTAFVSGLSRWYALGVGGARLARKAASSALMPSVPPDVEGSIG